MSNAPEFTGSCLCGKARYEARSPAVAVGVCHCKNCQRQTGTSFSLVVGVPKEAFSAHGETIRVYEDTGATGGKVLRHFCGECGSPLYTIAEMAPALRFMKAGTLDDTSMLKPTESYWTDHRQAWLSNFMADRPAIARNP